MEGFINDTLFGAYQAKVDEKRQGPLRGGIGVIKSKKWADIVQAFGSFGTSLEMATTSRFVTSWNSN
jgi:hypothetical protein